MYPFQAHVVMPGHVQIASLSIDSTFSNPGLPCVWYQRFVEQLDAIINDHVFRRHMDRTYHSMDYGSKSGSRSGGRMKKFRRLKWMRIRKVSWKIARSRIEERISHREVEKEPVCTALSARYEGPTYQQKASDLETDILPRLADYPPQVSKPFDSFLQPQLSKGILQIFPPLSHSSSSHLTSQLPKGSPAQPTNPPTQPA